MLTTVPIPTLPLDPNIERLGGLASRKGRGRERAFNPTPPLRELGKNIPSDPNPRMLEVVVGGVVDVGKAESRAQRAGLRAGKFQQRSHHSAFGFDSLHPAQAPQPGATAQMQQDGLGLVRRRVRQRDAVCPRIGPHLMQRGVPCLPSPSRNSRRRGVELQPPNDHREAQESGQMLDVRRLALRG